MPASVRLPFSPELRAAIFHFTVFGTSGAAAAYFSVWMANNGITSTEIGIINAAPLLGLLIINLFVGRLADRASDWKQMIVFLALLAGVLPVGLFFVTSFVGVLIVWTLISIPAGSLPPVVDAATLRMAERRGSSFAFIRAWGTVGAMLATAVTGLLVAWLGPDVFVPTVLICALARAGLSLQLPRFRAPEREPVLTAPGGAGRLRDVLKPWFVLPLVAFALVQTTHAILVGFGALIWVEQGVPQSLIGPLVAISAAAEAVMMFVWRRIGGRISARQMILAAAIVTAVRWALVALSPPIWALFLLQMLHAITFAIGYLGTVHFIANWTREDIAAEAQGFSFVLQQGVSVVGLVIFGWLAGLYGAGAFFFAAALGVVATICVLASLRMRRPHETSLTAAA